jgi:hypothetical protein
MQIQIGSAEESSDLVGLLLACHRRIRFFVDLALRLAGTEDASPNEIQDAAARIVRYFAESLPLDVADEVQTIIPRLSGREPGLDITLQTMHREHTEHEPLLDLLVQTCRIMQAPQSSRR